jgi:hypothetical protein
MKGRKKEKRKKEIKRTGHSLRGNERTSKLQTYTYRHTEIKN